MISVHSYTNSRQLVVPTNKVEAPIVSIIYPLPPTAKWDLDIAQPLQSVLDQTFQSYEVIVIGDGADESVQQAIAYLQRDEPRLKFVNFKKSYGLTALQLNEGINMAQGTYVTYIYSEVIWTTDALSTLLQSIQTYNKPTVVYAGPPFNYNNLHKANFIAPYAVMHHKELVHHIGGFEYHIAARKFYDWDFWLRCAEKYRFIPIQHNIVMREPQTFDISSPSMISYHMMTARIFISIHRRERLQLNEMNKYNVNDMSFLYEALHPDIVDYIYEYEMLPWLSTLENQPLEKVKSKPPTSSHLLVALQHMDASYEICIANYREATKNKLLLTYFYENELNEITLKLANMIVLFRLTHLYSIDIINKAIQHNKPVIYMMDDDLLGVHELESFAYIAPGTEAYNRLVYLVVQSDIVVTYSPIVSEAIRKINPRVVQLRTNILEKYIKNKKLHKRKPNTPFRIGIVNTGSRSEEVNFIWPAIQKLSAEFGEAISFQIWGRLPEGLPPLHSPLHCEASTFSYYEYLERLSQANLDLLLVPLFNNVRVRRAKAPIKYLETTAAGCIGLYSNNETYDAVKQGVTGYKINNTIEDWYQAMKNIVEMPAEQRSQMCHNAMQDVLNNYTSESRAVHFESMLSLAQFHSLTRHKRGYDGKPKIAVLIHPQQCGRFDFNAVNSLSQYGINIAWRLPESMMDEGHDVADAIHALGGELEYVPDVLFQHNKNEKGIEDAQSLIDALTEWLSKGLIALVHCSLHNIMMIEAAKRANIPCVVHTCESVQVTHLLKAYNTALQWRGNDV